MFELTAPLTYYSAILGRDIHVHEGFVTDFASIPALAQSFIPVNGRHREAACVHDYLCVYKAKMEIGGFVGIDQLTVDRVFLEAMEVLEVRWTQRRVMYRAVRVYQTIKGWFA